MTAFPKPRPQLHDRVADKRDAEARMRAFKRQVWERDEGRCRFCARRVIKCLEATAQRGEVHHRRGRRVAPQDRYNVAEAVLLCGWCHLDPDVIQHFRRPR